MCALPLLVSDLLLSFPTQVLGAVFPGISRAGAQTSPFLLRNVQQADLCAASQDGGLAFQTCNPRDSRQQFRYVPLDSWFQPSGWLQVGDMCVEAPDVGPKGGCASDAPYGSYKGGGSACVTARLQQCTVSNGFLRWSRSEYGYWHSERKATNCLDSGVFLPEYPPGRTQFYTFGCESNAINQWFFLMGKLETPPPPPRSAHPWPLL